MENYNSNVGFTMVDMVETESQADKDSVVDKKKRELSLDNDLTLQVFFYRLMKPITLVDENGKDLYPRESEIVVNDFTKNVYFIHKDPIVDTGKNGDRFRKVRAIVSQGEESLEMQQLSRDANTFRNMVKRRVYINEDISFLQEGIWVASVNKELDKDSDLTKVWFYAGNQASMYFAKGEVDNARSMELVSAIMEDQANLVVLQQLDQFNTVNGNALILKWESPKKLLSSETQAPKLDRIEVRGKWRETLVNTIQLKGYDKLLQTLMDIDLKVPNCSIIMNPIQVGKQTLFYLPWSRTLSIGNIKKYILAWKNLPKLDTTSYTRFSDLLEFDEGTNVPKTLNGKVQTLTMNLVPLSNVEVNSKTKRDSTTWVGNIHDIKAQQFAKSQHTITFTRYTLDNEESNTYLTEVHVSNPVGANNVSNEVNWSDAGNGQDDKVSGLDSNDSHKYVSAYRIEFPWQRITYQNNSGNFITEFPAKMKKIKFKSYGAGATGTEPKTQEWEVEDGDILLFTFNQGVWDMYRYCNMAIFKKSIWNNFKYIQVRSSDTNTGPLEMSNGIIGDEEIGVSNYSDNNGEALKADSSATFWTHWNISNEQDTCEVIVQNESNKFRLYELFKKLLSFSWYYKNGFPSARFDQNGVEQNMGSLIKDKFTNSNYTPQQVITNLVEEYKTQHPNDLETQQWDNFMKMLPLFSTDITSDYNVNGGLNDQHKILLPFYGVISEISTLSTGNNKQWTDGPKGSWNDYENIPIDMSGISYDTIKGGVGGWIDKYYMDVYGGFKSEWFDFEYTYDDNGMAIDVEFIPKNNSITKPTMIEVGSIERMFREIQDSMSESDLITIATDMNLSNDYINYEFKILCKDQNEVRQIVNNTIANKDIVKFTKKDLYDYLVITPKDENGKPIEDDYLSIKVDDNISNFIPTNMTWKGVFGVPINLKFVYKTKTQDGEDLVEESVEFDINLYNEKDDSVVKTEIIL